LYNDDLLDIIEISKIHNRTPGGIISRLFKNKYIGTRQSARGYTNYINSDLYKEIVSNNNDKRKIEKKVKSTTKLNNMLELTNDVKEMKTEIKDLKNNIKELIEMIKLIYEFEDA
jgi:hypothetical protein